jgi:hypothetical protein
VPQGGGDDEGGVWSGGGSSRDGVLVVVAIAAKNYTFGLNILDRKTKSVKFYESLVVSCKLMNV